MAHYTGEKPKEHALKILIWSIPLIFVIYLQQTLLISTHEEYLTIKITLIALIINIILNLKFIPYYSYIGASIVTVITELFLFIAFLYYLSKLVYRIEISRIIFKPVIASIFMGLFIYYVKIDLIITILCATIIYFAVMFIIKGFSKEDSDIFKQIIEIERLKRQ